MALIERWGWKEGGRGVIVEFILEINVEARRAVGYRPGQALASY